MADDPLQVVKIYFVIDKSTFAGLYDESEWSNLYTWFTLQPLVSGVLAIAQACQNFLVASKRSYGSGTSFRYTLGCFEIATANVPAFWNLVHTRATADNVTGTDDQQLAGVLQAELRQVAVAAGWSAPQAVKLKIILVNAAGVYDRMAAIGSVQTYLATNAALWYAPA